MRKKVLLVEDNVEVLELLRFNLKKAGFSVGTAGDGVEALKKSRSLLPDVILLDVMLPELDGFAVCEILRRHSDTARVPIIMITALSGEIARFTGLSAGACAYITKPFSPRQVISCVERMLIDQRKIA